MEATLRKNNLFFRQMLFLGILILIGAVLVKQLAFFVGSFLGAFTLYIVFREGMFSLVEKHRWKPWLAALMFVVASALVLVGLLFGVFKLVAVELQNIDTNTLFSKVKDLPAKINDFMGFTLISDKTLGGLTSYAGNAASAIINSTYSFVINILLMIVILYFMLIGGRKMEARIGRYNPFRGESRKIMNEEITSIIYSNAVGIPVIMLGQGLVAALIYWLFGMHNIVFWAFITALCGLIPMIGTIIVSVPLGISFIANGEILKGILLMLCGFAIISNVDNLFRIILNKKVTNTHPLIVIFGVIMGIPLFGFWGIIFGPLLISVFLLLIKLYYVEFKLMTPAEAELEAPAEKDGVSPFDKG